MSIWRPTSMRDKARSIRPGTICSNRDSKSLLLIFQSGARQLRNWQDMRTIWRSVTTRRPTHTSDLNKKWSTRHLRLCRMRSRLRISYATTQLCKFQTRVNRNCRCSMLKMVSPSVKNARWQSNSMIAMVKHRSWKMKRSWKRKSWLVREMLRSEPSNFKEAILGQTLLTLIMICVTKCWKGLSLSLIGGQITWLCTNVCNKNAFWWHPIS